MTPRSPGRSRHRARWCGVRTLPSSTNNPINTTPVSAAACHPLQAERGEIRGTKPADEHHQCNGPHDCREQVEQGESPRRHVGPRAGDGDCNPKSRRKPDQQDHQPVVAAHPIDQRRRPVAHGGIARRATPASGLGTDRSTPGRRWRHRPRPTGRRPRHSVVPRRPGWRRRCMPPHPRPPPQRARRGKATPNR